MEITSLNPLDWRLFLDLTKAERWRVPGQELDLFRGPMADGVFALRADGQTRGFATTAAHGKSGWIGNLIVPPDARGQGYGTTLLEHAIDELTRKKVATIWLTASAAGRPLYVKKGFRTFNLVERWTKQPDGVASGAETTGGDPADLLTADRVVWGESRRILLDQLAAEGKVLSCGETVALLQRPSPLRVLGPWVSPTRCLRENRLLLASALAAAGSGGELVADVLETSPVRPLLRAAGFTSRGRCDLMVRGPSAGVDLSSLMALASLGSMG